MSLFPAHLPILHGPEFTEPLAAWAAGKIAHVGPAGFGPCWAIGIVRHNALAAVVVYHDWQRAAGTAQVSVAAETPAWASRAVIRALLGATFGGALGAPIRKVWAVMPHTSARALRFNRGIGFKQEAILRHHFAPGIHAVISSMLDREFARRYERESHGQVRPVAA